MGVMFAFMSATPLALHWMLYGPLGISALGSVELPNVVVFAMAAAIILLIVFLLIALLRTRRASATLPISRAPRPSGDPSSSATLPPLRRAGAEPKTVHIMPRDVTLVDEHRTDLSPAQIRRLTAEQVRALPKQEVQMFAARDISAMTDAPTQRSVGDDDVANAVQTARVTTLRRGPERSFSLIVATLSVLTPGGANADEQTGLLELVNGLSLRIAGKGKQEPGAPLTDLTLVATAPNWLASGCYEGSGGSGGPGGMPVPPGNTPASDAWRISLPTT